MNKEDILAMSRQKHADEGIREAENCGQKIGITACCLMTILIVLFNLFHGPSNNIPFVLFWTFITAEAYPKYKFTGNRTFLITTITGSIIAFCYLLIYVLDIL